MKYLILAIALTSMGFGTGWQVHGWKLKGELAVVERDIAKGKASAAASETASLITAAKDMRTAADNYSKYRLNLKGQLEVITNEIRGIKDLRPLPVDCKPDDERVRRLERAVRTINAAIASP